MEDTFTADKKMGRVNGPCECVGKCYKLPCQRTSADGAGFEPRQLAGSDPSLLA